MAYGDPQYQINDLTARLRMLENQVRAVNPGNRPSRGPDHPMQPVTSSGQTVAFADSDAQSRALTTAVQSAFAGAESLEDTVVARQVFPVIPNPTLHQTFIRPDPVVGESYRIWAGGLINNNDGFGINLQFFFDVRSGGGTLVDLGTLTTVAGDERIWLLLLTVVVQTAGTTGTYAVTARLTDSNLRAVANAATAVNQDFLQDRANIPDSLVSPVFTLQAQRSAGTAASTITLDSYLVERLGVRAG